MIKLTREEASKMKAKPDKRGSYARGIFLTMEVGEIILLEPKDWKRKKQPPSTYLLQLERQTGWKWKIMTVMDGSGWLVERMK